MRIGTAFPSKYLKSSDIPNDRPVNVIMDHVAIENVAGNDNPDDEKPVLYFQGKTKGMVLNKTNSQTISGAYGEETDDWGGKSVQLTQAEVLFQGKMVPCLRIKIPRAGTTGQPNGNRPAARAAPAPRQAVTSPVSEGSEIDEADIPF